MGVLQIAFDILVKEIFNVLLLCIGSIFSEILTWDFLSILGLFDVFCQRAHCHNVKID